MANILVTVLYECNVPYLDVVSNVCYDLMHVLQFCSVIQCSVPNYMEFDPTICLSPCHCHQATCVSHYHSVFTQGSLVTSSSFKDSMLLHLLGICMRYINTENNVLLWIIVPLP